MKWQDRRGSSNVRTTSGGGKMIGGGIGGIIIAGILWLGFDRLANGASDYGWRQYFYPTCH